MGQFAHNSRGIRLEAPHLPDKVPSQADRATTISMPTLQYPNHHQYHDMQQEDLLLRDMAIAVHGLFKSYMQNIAL